MNPTRKSLDGRTERARIYEVLGSFDANGLDDATLTRRTLALLRITPGPDDTAAGADPAAASLARYAAEMAQRDSGKTWLVGTHAQAADDILAHRFCFYTETHQLPAALDWNHNPGTGHWGHDLNRFSYLGPLAQAWDVSGERRYAEKAIALILDWIAKNDVCDAFPPGRSPYVWSSYLNIAIHLEVWASTLARLLGREPDLVTPGQWLRILKSMHDQLAYLDFVIPEKRGNWVTIGCRGMLATLARLPHFGHSASWTSRAWERLTDAVDEQVRPDGAQDELTPHYHLVVVRNLLTARRLSPYLVQPPPARLDAQLTSMLRYLRHVITPDGKLVAFNDSDPASGPGALRDLASPDVLTLLGDEADTELRSTHFPYAGVMLLRQGSRHGDRELYLAFDGGPYGTSHQHEDALSFWLSAYGRSFIVDPGRHLYDNSAISCREYLKSTQAHSTITIDGLGQNSAARPDTWRADAPLPLLWQALPDGATVAGASYTLGYGPASLSVTHTRTIRFMPDPGAWIVEDLIEGKGEHLVESRLQFAPGAVAVDGSRAFTMYDDANLLVATRPADWDRMQVQEGHDEPRAGWYSDNYGEIEPAPSLLLTTRRTLPLRTRYVLYPYRGPLPPRTLPVALTAALH